MNPTIKRFLLCFAYVLLAGCSYLEDYFPDKEKDYQYTTEIPMLNWPSELRGNKAAAGSESPQPENSVVAAEPANPADPQAAGQAGNGEAPAGSTENSAAVKPTEIKESESDERTSISSVEIVKYDDGESRLRLGTRLETAWRAVSKALSHNTIEVTERNHDQGLITVQYDPDEKKASDDSYLDEIKFFFSGVDTNEQQYQLKLEEHGENTDVLVLNEEHLPMLNNAPALRLLKVIGNTIKADQPDKKSE